MGRPHLIDPNFRKNWRAYVAQSLLAAVILLDIMWFWGVFAHAILVASIGSTAFILFTMIDSPTARARNAIGSHALCGLIGAVCAFIPGSIGADAVRGAFAVGISIFVMVVTDTEHPPAAGTALAFALSGWDAAVYFHLLLFAVTLWALAYLMRPWMRSLV